MYLSYIYRHADSQQSLYILVCHCYPDADNSYAEDDIGTPTEPEQ